LQKLEIEKIRSHSLVGIAAVDSFMDFLVSELDLSFETKGALELLEVEFRVLKSSLLMLSN